MPMRRAFRVAGRCPSQVGDEILVSWKHLDQEGNKGINVVSVDPCNHLPYMLGCKHQSGKPSFYYMSIIHHEKNTQLSSQNESHL